MTLIPLFSTCQSGNGRGRIVRGRVVPCRLSTARSWLPRSSSRRDEMFIETAAQQNMIAPAERNVALRWSAIFLKHRFYKYLAPLEP